MDIRSIVEAQHRELRALLEACDKHLPVVTRMAEKVVATLRAGGKIITAGNGGSATDAMHMVEELVGRYKGNRRALPALCLVADAATISCIANDFGYEQVFARQLDAMGGPADLLVLFTTSGNSANLLAAHETAKRKKIFTIALLGRDGGKLKGRADLEWIVPHQQAARIQEVHTWVMHAILEAVEIEFGGK
jgi:D-sedoheptulose 7-phosphate isomerase